MLIVQIDPSSLSPTELAALRRDFIAFFRAECGLHNEDGTPNTAAQQKWSATVDGHVLTSLLWQMYSGITESISSGHTEVLYGKPYLTDQLSGLTFQVSPHAFFQVNTRGAEKLYSIATEWGRLNRDTTLFDICCGTGTIGLTIAKNVHKVIGLEIIQSAIDDANNNAKLNSKRHRFIASSLHPFIPSSLHPLIPSSLSLLSSLPRRFI